MAGDLNEEELAALQQLNDAVADPTAAFTTVIAAEANVARRTALEQRLARTQMAVTEGAGSTSRTLFEEEIAGLILANINGGLDLPEQRVTVEYLRQEQRLRIPYAMAMSVTRNVAGLVGPNEQLVTRYRKMALLSFAEIETLTRQNRTSAMMLNTIRNLPMAPEGTRRVDWSEPGWLVGGAGVRVDDDYAVMIMSQISTLLGFNCDIRDTGVLTLAEMTIDDAAWADVREVPANRLKNKVHTFTFQTMAALNYTPCAAQALAAWARSYGVAIGLHPAATSMGVPERVYTYSHPTHDELKAVCKFLDDYQDPIPAVCGNLLAMFGIFHLNKDHTYKTNDVNMLRIGKSYIKTLRTNTNTKGMDTMEAAQEVYVRTCQHPFGLAQTYWLARVMHKFDMLMAPLKIRITASPPPVQRAMIADAAAKEWASLPPGQLINNLWADSLATIKDAIALIHQSPPSYSSLHRLYAVEKQERLDANVIAAIDSLMPQVFGYVQATHVLDDNSRDGLGHAMSLSNVEKDSKGNSYMWKNLWEKYMSDADKDGLMAFIKAQYDILARQ